MRYIWFVCICMSVLLVTFFINFIVNINSFRWPDESIFSSITSDLAYHYTDIDFPTKEKDILNYIQGDLLDIARHLKAYRAKNNRYPTNDEGLTVLSELKTRLIEEYSYLPVPMGKRPKGKGSVYYGSLGGMCSFEGGILSSWFEPFIYENRNGLPENLFSDSPVNNDRWEFYSIRVDDGIYVYSLSAIAYYHDYVNALAKRSRTRLIVWCLLAIAFALLNIFIYLFIRLKKPSNSQPAKLGFKLIKTIGGIIIILGAVLIGLKKPYTYNYKETAMCYDPVPNFDLDLSRRPEIISQYNDLLDKYNQRGVINQVTYQKIKKALDDVNKIIK